MCFYNENRPRQKEQEILANNKMRKGYVFVYTYLNIILQSVAGTNDCNNTGSIAGRFATTIATSFNTADSLFGVISGDPVKGVNNIGITALSWALSTVLDTRHMINQYCGSKLL